jgi:hypothetical protein
MQSQAGFVFARVFSNILLDEDINSRQAGKDAVIRRSFQMAANGGLRIRVSL